MIDRNISTEVDVRYFGQRLQRHLIYVLLEISSRYVEKRTYGNKEFESELTLILFKEPEAFYSLVSRSYLEPFP